MIYEDIIHFSNKKDYGDLSEQEIVNKAREIAVGMLKDKLNTVPVTKNTIFLKEAIANSMKVRKSEVTYG